MLELSVIIPAYKKEGCILKTLKETTRCLNNMTKSYEIIVVDDGSPDNTFQEARQAAQKCKKIRVFRYKNNHGKGNALKYGFTFAKGKLIAFMDADLDIHPRQLKAFLDIIQKGRADVVIGSKRHPLTKIDYPWDRRFLSSGYSTLVKILFGLSISDTQTGMKLFRAEVLERVFPKVLVKRYAFDSELLINIHKLGYRIEETPIILNFGPKFQNIKLKDIWGMAIDTAAIFYRMYFLRYYDRDFL